MGWFAIRVLLISTIGIGVANSQPAPVPAAPVPAAPVPATPVPATPVPVAPAPVVPSQEPLASTRLHVNARAGVNFASAASDPNDDRVTNRTGIGFQGAVGYSLSTKLFVEAGLGYTQRGFGLRSNFPPETNRSVKLDYIELPAVFGGLFPIGENDSLLRVFGGLAGMLLINAKSTNRDTGETLDIKDDLRSLDVAVVVGVGVEIPLSGFSLIADLRFDFGLVNTLRDGMPPFESYKNRNGGLLAGIAF